MKKTLSALIIAGTAFAMAGCSSEQAEHATPSTTAASLASTPSATTPAWQPAAPPSDAPAPSATLGSLTVRGNYLQSCGELVSYFDLLEATAREEGDAAWTRGSVADELIAYMKQSDEWSTTSERERSETVRAVRAAESGHC